MARPAGERRAVAALGGGRVAGGARESGGPGGAVWKRSGCGRLLSESPRGSSIVSGILDISDPVVALLILDTLNGNGFPARRVADRRWK